MPYNYDAIIKQLKLADEFLQTVEGGEVHHTFMNRYIGYLEHVRPIRIKDKNDLKRYRAKEDEGTASANQDTDAPAPPAPPPPAPPAPPPARPARPRGTRRPAREPAEHTFGQCDCRVGAGNAQYRLKQPAARCKQTAMWTRPGPNGTFKNLCNRHHQASERALEKYVGWTVEKGHIYGWWGQEDWSKSKPRVKPEFNAKKRPRKKKTEEEPAPEPTPESHQQVVRPPEIDNEIDEDFNPDRYDDPTTEEDDNFDDEDE